MGSDSQRVGAISTYLQRLEEIERQPGKFLFFRGHSKMSFKLGPKVYRNAGWIANEAEMFKDLVLRCPDDFANGLSTLESLVKMQHYGLPTRLMDITSNPLVALYFACEVHKDDDEDGEVIVFGFSNSDAKYFDSDTVSVLANLCRRPADFEVPNAPLMDGLTEDVRVETIKRFNAERAITLLLHDVGQDKPHFKPGILPVDLGRVLCVKTKLDNPRIVRQEGAFLLYGCAGKKQNPAELPEHSILGRIAINSDQKKDLLRHLETLGVSKATLFPEIDDVASFITNSYEAPDLSLKSLSATQTEAVTGLRTIGKANAKELAEMMKVTPRSASQTIARLFEKKLIEPVGSGRARRWKLIDALMEVPAGEVAV